MPTDPNKVVDTLDLLKQALNETDDKISQLTREIDQLREAGMVNASEWWKDDKYLYLVFPTDDNGKRVRQYVGSDESNVAIAQAKIKRYHQWVTLRQQRETLREKKRHAVANLDLALHYLKSTQRRLWGE